MDAYGACDMMKTDMKKHLKTPGPEGKSQDVESDLDDLEALKGNRWKDGMLRELREQISARNCADIF